ncbi:MAG: hypothetical protein ACLR2D_07995 [Anaerobutyricum hallii]
MTADLEQSFEKDYEAIDEVYSDDGVAIFMDLGSAVMTTEMVWNLWKTVRLRW